MSGGLAGALVPVLLLVPGLALLPPSISRRLQLPFVIFTSVAVTSLLSLVLMSIGVFSVPAVAAVEGLLLLRLRARSRDSFAPRGQLLVLGLWLAVAAFALVTAGEPYDATGDAGVYTLAARHLADSGRWSWQLADLVPPGVPEELVVNTAPYVRPWLEIAPGFIVRGDAVVPQFFPVYAVWGAIFHAWFGIHGVLAANVFAALLLLLASDLLLRLLVGRRWRIAGLASIVLNPVFLIFLRYPSAEIFLAGLLAGWLFWMVLFVRAPTVRGALLPAALLAVAVLTKFFAWAVAGVAVLVLVMLPRDRLRAALVFPAALAPAAVVGWLLAAPHLENHLGQLLILSGFKIVVVGCGLVLALRLVWTRVAGIVPPLLAMVYGAGLLALWFGSAAGPLRDLAALEGRLVVWGSTVGLVWYLWCRRALWLVVPAYVFVLLTLYLLLGSGDSPYYPFAARRFLPVTVPVGGLFVAYLGARIARVGRRWLPTRSVAGAGLAAALLAAALLPAPWIQRAAILVPEGDGFLETRDRIERAVAGGTLVFATGNGWRYAPHFLLAGQPVYCLDLERRGVLADLDELFSVREEILVLTDEPREVGVLDVIEERRRLIAVTTSPPLEAAPIRGSTFRVFAARRGLAEAPAVIDVGSDDQLLVAGGYRAERAEGRSFRWTGPSARVLAAGARRVRFLWSPGSHPTHPLPVSVLAGGRTIGFARLERGWHTSRWFKLPSGESPMVIEIRTQTFQPAELDRGHDLRRLGLRLDAVEVR